MSFLPGAGNATIADDKIRDYLMNHRHPVGAAKAKFFSSAGFTLSNEAELKRALLEHPQINHVSRQISTKFGVKHEVSCTLMTPDGRNPCIISVWIIEPPDSNPRLVTAYPHP
jgi:hypothetical protein